MKHTGILACLLMLGTASCISDRHLRKVYRKSPDARGGIAGANLNGTYSNHPYTGNVTLTDILLPRKGFDFKPAAVYGGADLVTLQYDEAAKILHVTVQDSSGHTHFHDIPAKRKNRYISLKRSGYNIPVPVLFYVEKNKKALLFRDGEGELTTAYRIYEGAWILFGAAGYGEDAVYRFQAVPASSR